MHLDRLVDDLAGALRHHGFDHADPDPRFLVAEHVHGLGGFEHHQPHRLDLAARLRDDLHEAGTRAVGALDLAAVPRELARDVAHALFGRDDLDARYAGAWELPALGEVAAPTAVLIRPDGHVAWVGEHLSDAGLPDALTIWFGPPFAV